MSDVTFSSLLELFVQVPWPMQLERFAALRADLALRAAGAAATPENVAMPRRGPAQFGSVRLIPIFGTIVHRGGMADLLDGVSTEALTAQIRAAVADPQVRSIVLDIDSGGGAAMGIPELAAEIRAARDHKRVVAIANGTAGSAAYWLGSQASRFFATPSGHVGSIGVYAAHMNLAGLLEQMGVSISFISSGKYKVEGNPFEPLSDEAREHLQERVDAIHDVFVKDVARGRGRRPSEVRSEFGQGRMLLADRARAAGMIDGVATMDQVLHRLTRGKQGNSMRSAAQDDLLDADDHHETVEALSDLAAFIRGDNR